jgi:hypothetical protein
MDAATLAEAREWMQDVGLGWDERFMTDTDVVRFLDRYVDGGAAKFAANCT